MKKIYKVRGRFINETILYSNDTNTIILRIIRPQFFSTEDRASPSYTCNGGTDGNFTEQVEKIRSLAERVNILINYKSFDIEGEIHVNYWNHFHELFVLPKSTSNDFLFKQINVLAYATFYWKLVFQLPLIACLHNCLEMI